jgi:hypothetical protein
MDTSNVITPLQLNIFKMTDITTHVVIEIPPAVPTSTPVISTPVENSVNYKELITKLEYISKKNASESDDMTKKYNTYLNIFTIIMRTIYGLSYLGMGVWAAVVLANTSHHLVSTQIYGYVMTKCILHFVFMSFNFVSNKSLRKFYDIIDLGMFVWNCVILFSQIGIDNYMANNYYYYVFVEFVFSIVLIGVTLLSYCISCCLFMYND